MYTGRCLSIAAGTTFVVSRISSLSTDSPVTAFLVLNRFSRARCRRRNLNPGSHVAQLKPNSITLSGSKLVRSWNLAFIEREFTGVITFRVSSASVCLAVFVSVRGRMPTLSHGPGCSLEWYGMPPSCALLGEFAIGSRVALLWQHNANAKC